MRDISGVWGWCNGLVLTRASIDSLSSYLILKFVVRGLGGRDDSDYGAAGDNLTY